MSYRIDFLLLIPDVAAIGLVKLQGYCDEWLQRPIAREHGVAQLNVRRDLSLEALLDAEDAERVDSRVFIPLDELVGYIIDQHFFDSEQRRQLHAHLRDIRRRWSGFDRDQQVTFGKVATI
jgi:hypothetical protein